MIPALAFQPLGGDPSDDPTLPPRPVTPGNYGLVDAPALGGVVYAPSTEHHTAGAAWLVDAAGFRPLATGTWRGPTIAQPWHAVWDAPRGRVVAWSWDHATGPVGVVIEPGAAPRVLSSALGADERLTGDVPALPARPWGGLVAWLGHDPARGVTCCIHPDGVWELEGTRWRRREVALDALPPALDGSGFMTSGFGAAYDARHGRLVCWGQVYVTDEIVLVAWDGRALTRVDTGGLPAAGRDGFVVGAHPDHGVVVLVDGALFAPTGATGGFARLDTAPGAPRHVAAAQLAYDRARGALVLGPQRTLTDEHRFFVGDDHGWRASGRPVARSALARLGGQARIATGPTGAFAVDHAGEVARWDEARARWELARPAAAPTPLATPITNVLTAWGGAVHAVCEDGAVLRLDDDADGVRWTCVVAAPARFQPGPHPLAAFDPARGLVVLWGSLRSQGKRIERTYACDGAQWVKITRGEEPPDRLGPTATGHYAMFFEPSAGMIARLSPTQLSLFDGAAWTHHPHGFEDAIARRTIACVAPGARAVLLISYHAHGDIRRLVRTDAGYALAPVARPVPPVARDPHAPGANAAFDVGWFDAARRRLVVHLPDDATASFALDLGALFDGGVDTVLTAG